MDNLHLEALLIPALLTGCLGLTAAAIKIYEYYHRNGDSVRRIDLLMWVAVVSRIGIGLIFLFAEQPVLSVRTVEIRFCVTLLLLVEVLRGFRKVVVRKHTREVVQQLGWPEEQSDGS